MDRLISIKQIIIAQSCRSFSWQEAKKTFLVVGDAENGKGAAFSCIVENGIVVVTVMWRHLTKMERSSR